MNISFEALIPIVYVIVESLEKMGLQKKIAHLLAIPLGIILSFFLLQNMSFLQRAIYGVVIGIGAVGSCDTINHIACSIKK